MTDNRDFALETWLRHCQTTHNHVHLQGDCFEDARSEPRVEVRQVVRDRGVEDFFGALPMRRYGHSFETITEAERVLQLFLPVDDVRDDLELVIKVATLDDLFYPSVKLRLSCLLSVDV